MEIIALADDLTGALEVGSKFAANGIGAHIGIGQRPPTLSVIDTETRHVSPGDAARTVERLLRDWGDVDLVYLKTDSTLRGNIGAELEALMRLYPDSPVIYAPAYPAMGRTVKSGYLRVHGVPVHETSFARDALNPIRTSFIPDVIPGGLAIRLFDGETEDDIAAAAREILGSSDCRIAAGPAALAEHLAQQIDLPRGPIAPLPAIQKCLVVSGSRHEISLRQIAQANAGGFCADGWSILTPPAYSRDPAGFAKRTGLMVRDILEKMNLDAVVVFGGDTAFGVLDALGRPVLTSIGEVLPGVPISRIDGRGLHLITKAGGFGDEDVLFRLKKVLHG
jgi:D-threonate/D-erythronate kinase